MSPSPFILMQNAKFLAHYFMTKLMLAAVALVWKVSNLEGAQGPIFGRLLALEILNSFVQQYSSQLVQISANLKDFSGFNHKISDSIRNSIRPALDMLASVNGVQLALIVSGDNILFSTHKIDKVGVRLFP